MAISSNKFELRAPHPQNAVDIFAGHWASDFSNVLPGVNAGIADLFVADRRPLLAAAALGKYGRFDGMSVLELGPLEAGHTLQLERMGADYILGIEANSEAYLKCLIVKELLNLKSSRFVFGDFVEFLKADKATYDVVFASGVLYHMADPIELLTLMANRADRAFLWTHYYDPNHYTGPARTERIVPFSSGSVSYFELEYPDVDQDKFWGGNKRVASWLPREHLVRVLQSIYKKVDVLVDEKDHPNGACMSIAVSK